MSCTNTFGTVPRDAAPLSVVTGVTAACAAKVASLTAATLSAASFATTPFDMTGLSNAQVVTTVTAQRSVVAGNLVQFSADMQLALAVDASAYPVVVGTIPAAYAPPVAALTFTPIKAPDVIFSMSVNADGTISTCPTGYPFPAGVYTLTLTLAYII